MEVDEKKLLVADYGWFLTITSYEIFTTCEVLGVKLCCIRGKNQQNIHLGWVYITTARKPIWVDFGIVDVSRCKFTWVCVEIDLEKLAVGGMILE